LTSAAAQGEALCTGADVWSCTATFKIQGPCNGDHMGFSVSGTGDWNTAGSAGLNDVLVGDTYPWEAPVWNHPEAGFASLFYSETLAQCDVADLRICGSRYWVNEQTFVSTDPAQLPPYWQGDCFGWDVAFLGDIDGDTRDDFAVSAPRGPFVIATGDTPPYDPPGSHWTERGWVCFFLTSRYTPGTGCQEVLPCGPSGNATFWSAAKSANLILEGAVEGGRLGHAIVRVGAYVAIGAPGGWMTDGPLSTYSGNVNLVPVSWIAATAATTTNCSVAPPLWTITSVPGVVTYSGTAAKDRFGHALANVGDVDGSGTDDLAVGAPQFQNEGDGNAASPPFTGPGYVRVVFLGGTSPCATPLTITGDQSNSMFGHTVSGGSDFDFDGKKDLVVGAPLFDRDVGLPTEQLDAGSAYVYEFAGCGLAATKLVQTYGVQSGEYYGWEVLDLGAFADLASEHWYAVSSRRFSVRETLDDVCPIHCEREDAKGGGRLCGRIYAYRMAETNPCFTVTGENERDSVGWAMSRVGHLGLTSSSPRPELLVTSPRWGPDSLTHNERGKWYIFER
jgi:hypothetical protein